MNNEKDGMEFLINAFFEHELSKNIKTNKFIDFILNRSSEITPEDLATMETNGIYLGDKGFVVLVFTSIVGSKIAPGEITGTRSVRSSLLINTVRNIMTDRYPHYVAEVGGRIVCLLCFTMDDGNSEHISGIMDSVAGSCGEAHETCQRDYGFDINATISSYWAGVSNISRAYKDCIEVLEFYQFRYGRVPAGIYAKQSSARLYKSAEDDISSNLRPFARRLSNAITVNDAVKTNALVDELLDFIFTAEPSSILHLHLRTVLFMNCFLSELTDSCVIDSGYTSNVMIITDLMSCDNEEGYRIKLKQGILEIVEYNNYKHQNNAINRIEEVKRFTLDNLSDTNLSVSSIADSFGISQPLLSAQFKKYTGTSLSDYIHKHRIQVAHDLIETTKMTINDISEAVGYSSIVTMYRAFRRFEGISPGQLR